MSRTLTTSMQAEIAKPALSPVFLVEAEFSSGPVRVWTGGGELSWDAKTWTGLGHLISIRPLADTQNVEANGMTITLSGVPSSLIAIVYGEFAQGRPCTVWLGMLDDSGAVIADPVRLNRGRLDAIADEDDATTATISVTVENGLRDLKKPNTRRYTNEDQQRLFPGDKSLEFVAGLQEREIYWGRAGASGI